MLLSFSNAPKIQPVVSIVKDTPPAFCTGPSPYPVRVFTHATMTANNHRKGPWTQGEDDLLLSLVHQQGALNWVRIASLVGIRTPKQCRERYHQNLKQTLNRDPISPEEGAEIERLVNEIGKRWAEIARRLNGRSDNAVKNWWNGSQNRRKRGERQPPASSACLEKPSGFATGHSTPTVPRGLPHPTASPISFSLPRPYVLHSGSPCSSSAPSLPKGPLTPSDHDSPAWTNLPPLKMFPEDQALTTSQALPALKDLQESWQSVGETHIGCLALQSRRESIISFPVTPQSQAHITPRHGSQLGIVAPSKDPWDIHDRSLGLLVSHGVKLLHTVPPIARAVNN